MSSSRMRSRSAIPDKGVMRCITSSCLNSSANILAAQSASTSGATRMMTEEAAESGDLLCAVRILLYVSAYDGREADAR